MMSSRYLLAVLVVLIFAGMAITTRSTLEQERGMDHVFYGADVNHFAAEELAIGDFNGDGLDDVVTTILWDDPAPGGAPLKIWYEGLNFGDPCVVGWGVYFADSVYNGGADTLTVPICWFKNPPADSTHWQKWEELGWQLAPDSSAACDTCWTIEANSENQGAAYMFEGGNWSGKGHDINLSAGGFDRLIAGEVPGGKIYNGIAAGDVVVDGCVGCDELIAGAPSVQAGAVYVVRGSAFGATPDTVRAPSDTLVSHVFHGRRLGSEFGKGIASGDLNGDGVDDVVIAAPMDDAVDSTRVNAGVIYIFYSTTDWPAELDLSAYADDAMLADSTAEYLQVINGADSSLGVTTLREKHEDGHNGFYEPVGLAIGDWDGDGFDDLAIGSGRAMSDSGAVYVIFGVDPEGVETPKLVPGNTIDLAKSPGSAVDKADIRFRGKNGSAMGSGVAFIDADAQGFDRLAGAKDDLIIGAPYAKLGGDAGRWEYFGETYIVWGDSKGNLTSNADRDSTDVDVTIIGNNFDDQIGGHLSGNFDIDHDGKNDIGIAGQDVALVLFGQSRSDWPDTLDLATVLEESPEIRVVQWTGVPAPSSATIKLADLDGDDYHDLVFGGYDMPGKSEQLHAGQMWVAKGQDLWKNQDVSGTVTWSGNVFVNGDINVAPGATLTIAAGTDVWIWPADPDTTDDLGEGYPSHVDKDRIEFRVHGTLNVNGTAQAPVRFLAFGLDSLESEARDTWFGISIADTMSSSATFDHCVIRNAQRAVQSNADLTITNSVIEHCENLGISVAGDDSTYVKNVTMHNVGFIGLNMLQGARVRLEDCNFHDLGDYGVSAYSGSHLYAVRDTIKNADIEAILVYGDDTIADIDDCLLNASYRGLHVDDDATVAVDGCTTNNDETFGIYCVYSDDVIVTDCTIQNSSAGISLYQSDITVTGTTMTSNDVGLQALQGAHPSVEDCDIIFNDTGVLATQGGNPDLGGGGGSDGNNEIHHSADYHVSNLSSGVTVDAENNYWRNLVSPCQPLASKINGSVNSAAALCSPPTVSISETVSARVPDRYEMSQNYPNPFNPTTSIPYAVPSPGGQVTIAIYNVRGQLVHTLVNGRRAPGFYAEAWNGTNNQGETVSTGVYFVLMRATGFRQARKLVLLK